MLNFVNGIRFFARVRTFATAAKVVDPVTPAEAAQRARLELKALGTPQVTPPKRPLTSYFLFAQQERENDPTLRKGNMVENAKIIAGRWRELSDAEKGVFKHRAETAKSDYTRAYETYLSQRTPTDILIEEKTAALKKIINPTKKRTKVAADPNKPKRPLSSYILFVMDMMRAAPDEQRRVVGEDLEGLLAKEKVSRIAKAWKGLSDEDKEPYVARYKEASAVYRDQKAAYETDNGIQSARDEINKKLKSANAKDAKDASDVTPTSRGTRLA
ncbi:hypothetical protein HK104_004857 [Borealophlyctis nickersoniae]|nr:hypothetical protein HK104_004857 [Borealophlyctis nickersoniae]